MEAVLTEEPEPRKEKNEKILFYFLSSCEIGLVLASVHELYILHPDSQENCEINLNSIYSIII